MQKSEALIAKEVTENKKRMKTGKKSSEKKRMEGGT